MKVAARVIWHPLLCEILGMKALSVRARSRLFGVGWRVRFCICVLASVQHRQGETWRGGTGVCEKTLLAVEKTKAAVELMQKQPEVAKAVVASEPFFLP